MTQITRKVCGDCGEESLDAATTCWACGSTRFLPPGVPFSGDLTRDLHLGGDRTTSLPPPERRLPNWGAAAIGGLVLALFCVGGYLTGRLAGRQVLPAAAGAPVAEALPSPPTPLRVPSGPSAYSTARDPDPDPRVTVRSGPLLPGQRPAEPGIPPAVVSAPARPAGTPASPPPPRVSSSLIVPPRMPLPPAAIPIPSPGRNTSVLTLRNGTDQPVQVSLDGPETRTATVAPGVTLPIPLRPGRYTLRTQGGGAASTNTLDLQPERTHPVSVERSESDGSERLVLNEPAT